MDIYLSVDVEADGPIPGPYSMLSLGVAVAARFDGSTFTRADPAAQTFYRELQPISDDFDPAALKVSGLDRAALAATGTPPEKAMTDLIAWVDTVRDGARPIVVGYPAPYDWMFLYWYLLRFAGRSPFGHSGCLDIKTMYAVKARATYKRAVKGAMPARLKPRRKHTHHALDDAIEQAELFANIFEWTP